MLCNGWIISHCNSLLFAQDLGSTLNAKTPREGKMEITIMFIEDHAMLLMARERMEEISRSTEQRRALRLAEAPPRSTRARLGTALIRLGHWILSPSAATPESPIGFRRAQS